MWDRQDQHHDRRPELRVGLSFSFSRGRGNYLPQQVTRDQLISTRPVNLREGSLESPMRWKVCTSKTALQTCNQSACTHYPLLMFEIEHPINVCGSGLGALWLCTTALVAAGALARVSNKFPFLCILHCHGGLLFSCWGIRTAGITLTGCVILISS